MALTIVETRAEIRAITGGVDTHADVHVAAALDPSGGLLGVRAFPATAAGYGRLLSWLAGFGTVCLVGIEGTGSYGAGLARHITTAGVRVVEVDRSDRQDRRRLTMTWARALQILGLYEALQLPCDYLPRPSRR
jgi:transposase